MQALACAGIAPAKFCSWAYITAFAPDDITSFTRQSQLTSERIFLFALEITDRSFTTVVYFKGSEAEHFLNTTVEEFDASEEIRSGILHRLQSKIKSCSYMEFRYHVIERKEKVAYPMQISHAPVHPIGSRGANKGLKRARNDSECNFYIRYQHTSCMQDSASLTLHSTYSHRKILQMIAVDTRLN